MYGSVDYDETKIDYDRRVNAALSEWDTEELKKLSNELYPQVVASFSRKKRCARCNMEYKQGQNIGSWSCRYHPGMVMGIPNHSDYYSCCHQKYNDFVAHEIQGCTPCDHTPDKNVTPHNIEDMDFPKILLPFISNSCRQSALGETYILTPGDSTSTIIKIRRKR